MADDGVGLAQENGGHGLGNMVDRATRLGATIRMEGEGPGTRITLTLPLVGDRPNG
jgi:signal transduction histidine kinase